jgi:hypothetical protein
VTFARLSRADGVAMAAALLLLLVMAMDWYTTKQGEELRRDAKLTAPGRSGGGEFEPNLKRERESAAAKQEKNAWQADAAVDRLALLLMLGAVAAAIAAATLRAADRRFEGPLTPSAVATWLGLAAAFVIAYRILQPPGLNTAAVIKAGAPLGLVLVGLLALSSRIAMRTEREPAAAAGLDLPPPVGAPMAPAAEPMAPPPAAQG